MFYDLSVFLYCESATYYVFIRSNVSVHETFKLHKIMVKSIFQEDEMVPLDSVLNVDIV